MCDGYASPKEKTLAQASLVPEASRKLNLTIARLDHGLLGNLQERRCFEIFEYDIGKEIMRAFNTSHTHRLILQASHSNEAMKHAVVALGALREHLIESRILIVQPECEDEKLNFARSQYSKAICQLQNDVSRFEVGSLELILACCLLLTIFDFLCGDDLTAQVHLKAGLAILGRCYPQTFRDRMRQQASDIQRSHPLVYDIFHTFAVMDLHAAIWLSLSCFNSPPLISPQIIRPPSVPTGVDPTLDAISLQLNYHLIRAHTFRHSVAISDSCMSTVVAPFHILAEKQQLLFDLQKWPSMLEQLLSTTESTEAMARRVSLMRMNYFSTLIGLSTYLQTSPTENLAILTPSFSHIIAEARNVLQPASPANRSALLAAVSANSGELDSCCIPLLAFVSGAIQPLYLTAVGCEDSAMCEMAVSMLENEPWREGAWNSAAMARIARRHMREKLSFQNI